MARLERGQVLWVRTRRRVQATRLIGSRAAVEEAAGGAPARPRLHHPCRPEPALGGRYHLHRDRLGLRLSRRDPRRLVAARRRLCDQQIH